MRITKREMFEKLGLCGRERLQEARFEMMAEPGDCEITVTVAIFRRNSEGRMRAEVMENYYHDHLKDHAQQRCLFLLDFIEINEDYVGFQAMEICGEVINLHDRRALADALSQFRQAMADVKDGKRPVFIRPSDREKNRNVLDDVWGGYWGGGRSGRDTAYTAV